MKSEDEKSEEQTSAQTSHPEVKNNSKKSKGGFLGLISGILLLLGAIAGGFIFRNEIKSLIFSGEKTAVVENREKVLKVIIADDSIGVYPDSKIIEDVLKEMRLKFEVISLPFETCVQKAQTLDEEFVCGIGASTIRNLPKGTEYSHPYSKNVNHCVFTTKKMIDINSIKQDEIAVQAGTTIEEFLFKYFPELHKRLLVLSDFNIILSKFKKGEIKGFICETEAGHWIRTSIFSKEKGSINLLPLKHVNEHPKYPKYNLAFVLNSNKFEFNEKFNKSLKHYLDKTAKKAAEKNNSKK